MPPTLRDCIGQRFCEDPRQQQSDQVILVPRASVWGEEYQTRDPTTQPEIHETSRIESALAHDTTTLPSGYLSPRAATQPPIPFHMRMSTSEPPSVIRFRSSTGPIITGSWEPPSNAAVTPPVRLSDAVPTMFPGATTSRHHNDDRITGAVTSNTAIERAQLEALLQQPPPVTAFGSYESVQNSLSAAVLDNAAAFMLNHRNRARKTHSMTLEEAWEAYDLTPKDNKSFLVTQDEFEFHYWVTNVQFRCQSPTQFLTDCMNRFPSFNIIPHPAVGMFLYRMAFGTGRLSLWHFRKVSQHTLETWNDATPLSLTVFPKKLTPPPAELFTQLIDLRDALENMHKMAAFYGSVTLQVFTNAAKHFFDSRI